MRSSETVKKYTYSAKRADNQENWCVIDATDQVLGRLASQVAYRIRGKHNPLYTPHVDTGDWVVVINADKIRLTGNKLDQKTYYRHSGYVGSLKSQTAGEMLEKKPEEVIRKAVQGMLPKNRLGRKLNKKLFVYAGDQHPHAAQKPEPIEIKG
jgi:large subunit ribosomal protein L13